MIKLNQNIFTFKFRENKIELASASLVSHSRIKHGSTNDTILSWSSVTG